MRVLTWNMGGFTPGMNGHDTRDEAWARLAAIDPQPDVAFLQEAPAPPEGFPGGASGPARKVTARIWTPRGDLTQATMLEGAGEHGWAATAQISAAVGPIALISLHARTQGSAVAHIEALLARLSDSMTGPFILAGDFNSCRRAEHVWPEHRHLEFFQTAESRHGMINCFWKEHGREQRTYWRACKDEGEPFQDDHIFVSAGLHEHVRSCSVLDYEAFRGISDHTPMVLQIDL